MATCAHLSYECIAFEQLLHTFGVFMTLQAVSIFAFVLAFLHFLIY